VQPLNELSGSADGPGPEQEALLADSVGLALLVVHGFTRTGGKISAIDVIGGPYRLRQLGLATLPG
jgi:hypothetical protein